MQEDYKNGMLMADPNTALDESQDTRSVPYSHCQPYLRPLPGEVAITGAAPNGIAGKRTGQAEEDLKLDSKLSL